MIGNFTRENRNLVESLFQLIYWYRGALSRDDAWAMTPAERESATDFLNERFKDAGEYMKKQVPVFL